MPIGIVWDKEATRLKLKAKPFDPVVDGVVLTAPTHNVLDYTKCDEHIKGDAAFE